MTTLCNVDGLKAEYSLTPSEGGGRKCTIVFSGNGKKLDAEKVSAGRGVISLYYTVAAGAKTTQRIWHFDSSLSKESPAQYSASASGDTLQVTLGDTASSKLFPCSGFVRGDLAGLISAPCVRARIMGKDIWAYFLYFDNGLTGDYALQFGKEALTVMHDSSKATAELRADDPDKRNLVVSLNSTGKDFKKLIVNLIRVTPSGFELLQELGEMEKGDGKKEFRWAPINRSGVELLWIFHTGIFSKHGPLKDAIEQLGGKVNRSVFADAGGRQMDDFVLGDDSTMKYKVQLIMERHFGSHPDDSTTMKYVRSTVESPRHVPPEPPVSQSSSEPTKFCFHCGSKIAESAKFCASCGQAQEFAKPS